MKLSPSIHEHLKKTIKKNNKKRKLQLDKNKIMKKKTPLKNYVYTQNDVLPLTEQVIYL